MSRSAFVTGGSGFVGGRLITSLVQAGWAVRALARSAEAERRVAQAGADPVRGDLSDSSALRQGMTGCEVVYHAAAHFKLWGPKKVFRRANVDGTRAIIDAALDAPSVRRLVYVSAAAVVMGDPVPQLQLNEEAPIRERNWAPYSSSKARAEKLVLEANLRRPDFTTVAIRPPFIWGVGMPSLDHMADMVQAGQFQWIGGGDQAMSTCHVDNLCHALALASEYGDGGNAYFVSDGQDGTLKSFLTALLATRGVVPTNRSAPFGAAWTIAGTMETFWRLLRLRGEPPLTKQMVRLIGKPFTLDISRAKADLGFKPLLSFEAGLHAMSGHKDAASAIRRA